MIQRAPLAQQATTILIVCFAVDLALIICLDAVLYYVEGASKLFEFSSNSKYTDENSGSEKPHGQFEVALSAPVWTSSTVNDPSQAHIRFWGHSSSHEQVVEIPEEHNKTCAAVPITVGAAKFVSYLKEVHALHIIFRDNGEDVASCTFPLVQIGPRTAGMGNQLAGEAQRDGADSETDALLKTLFEHLRSNKGQPKEENVDAQQVDIFALVHSACGRRSGRLTAAFNQCDQNKSGLLDAEDLAKVAEQVLPFVPSEEQLSFFRLMLDTKGTHEFTLPDLQTAVKECRDIVKSIQGSKQCESGEVLRRCAATLQQRSLELGKQFRSLDVGCQGELPIVTVLDIIQELTCSPESIRRYVVAKQHAICRSRLELLSLEDVRHMCRQIIEEHSTSKVHKRTVDVPAGRYAFLSYDPSWSLSNQGTRNTYQEKAQGCL